MEVDQEAPAICAAAHVIFGLNGNAAPLQIEGWSMPEVGHTWSIDRFSRTRIPYQPGRGTMVLELTVTPMIVGVIIRTQRLIVAVNGNVVGDEQVAGETTLGFAVPHQALDNSGSLIVTLSHPEAIVPADVGLNPDPRRLGFSVRDMLLLWVPQETPIAPRERAPLAVEAAGGQEAAVRFYTALSTIDLMAYFEGLGHNCEFGLMQRNVGAEPLGLLRFAGLTPHVLLRGLDMAFEGIEEPSRLRVFTEKELPGEEYLVRDDRYSVQFHTNFFEGQITPAELIEKLSLHLRFLRRQFQEVLENGSRIFVMHHPAARGVAHVLPILNLLRSHGPNVLLYVTEDRPVPPGTVVQEKADLFHGYIDRLVPMWDAQRINVAGWVSICANAYRMWREQGGGA